MLFKDPLKELWVPFGLNCFAVFINLGAASLSLISGSYWWILNIAAASFSAWMAYRDYRKIPKRKADLQASLIRTIRESA